MFAVVLCTTPVESPCTAQPLETLPFATSFPLATPTPLLPLPPLPALAPSRLPQQELHGPHGVARRPPELICGWRPRQRRQSSERGAICCERCTGGKGGGTRKTWSERTYLRVEVQPLPRDMRDEKTDNSLARVMTIARAVTPTQNSRTPVQM